MNNIFISYRHLDSTKDALLIFQYLQGKIGVGDVFMDRHVMVPGDGIREVVKQKLLGSSVLLVLIGENWLKLVDEQGCIKLNQSDDYVRFEVETALNQKGVKVVPILLSRTQMPKAEDLPVGLKPLAGLLGLDVDTMDPHAFSAAMDRLISMVRSHSGRSAPLAEELTGNHGKHSWIKVQGCDEFGQWATLVMGNVTQKLRWIAPGEFYMGINEEEFARFSVQGNSDWKHQLRSETPRHLVRLSQGFWLADTACTQELWHAITGAWPSHHQGSSLPVDQVSWDDVKEKFLLKLGQIFPGVVAALPSEAQWEYACRAGAQSAYYFDDAIMPDSINFNGNFPPPGVRPGLNRKQPLPVNAMTPNSWGLYQMHGNVWEWCEDGYRQYCLSTVNDPKESHGVNSRRVARGGSWLSEARKVRSACRERFDRGLRAHNLGFRFVLYLV